MVFRRSICVLVISATFSASLSASLSAAADQSGGLSRPAFGGETGAPSPRYRLSSTAERDPRVGEYQAGDPVGAIMMPVHVWGAAKTTGLFSVPKNTTLTSLLSYAQGPAVDADVHSITIKRTSDKTAEILVLKIKDLISDPLTEDVKLMPNDIVYIEPRHDLVSKDWVAFATVLSALATSALAVVLVRNNTR